VAQLSSDAVVETNRLILRHWRETDFEPFAKLNADPRVMEYFPAPFRRDETKAMLKVLKEKFQKFGYSFWATELKATQEFIGFVGLNIPGYDLPFSPCVEIGWRLSFAHWGKGYAPEAATACLEHGGRTLGLKEIVAFTAESNVRSRRVMEKIGMRYDAHGDFSHPKLSSDHPLSRHVLYRFRCQK
jgi:3-dehydroquinate dehydratase / shikimate dehydrogenase